MKKTGFNKLLRRLLAYRPWIFIISLFCNILIFSHSAAVAYFIRELLNTVEAGVQGSVNIFQEVIPFIVGILGVAMIRVAAIMVSAVIDNIRRFDYENLLRNNIMKIVYKNKNIKSIAGKSEKVFEIVDDDVPVCAFPADLLSEVLGYLVYSLIAISSLLIINWRVTIYIFIPLSIGILIIRTASKKIKENRKVNREIHEKVSETISDTSNLVQTIKISGAHNNVLKNYEKLNRKRLDAVLKDTLFESIIQAVTGGTVYIGTAIMMLVVAKSMMQGEFPIGDFSMFVCYLGTLASCVDRITELVAETKQAEVSYERIMDLVGTQNENELTVHHDLRAFRDMEKFEYGCMKRTPMEEFDVKNLTYCHDNRNGIHDISFNLKRGEIVVLAGGIGSGKSTVLNVLMGVVPKDSGQVFWNGTEIQHQKEFFIPPNVAYTPQIARMFSEPIRENLLLGKHTCEGEINHALYHAVFEGDVAEMESGLDTQAGSRGSRLSGGQKQRLALARMFIHDAELYVMDDSSSAIDIETEKEFWNRFEKNIDKKKFACIIASNKKYVLQRADKIIFLKNGHVIDCGKAEELSKRCEEFARIYMR
ncbi:ABC transporter ATP-binding protein [Oceanirhabdus seepicola]|uniref:ABC transporter ATP-binding protein n=1 Tax=Oceanirhabdus seepicola TaxID=2828781 RepID=A0A9J6NX29_9CLOT|nr:ABC transporter ATP-binding protein [Oceanirhabdus seepicola]MCM1989010.1 ABC transporter ATP-binding protein [Oceanirhabdus seepicola]